MTTQEKANIGLDIKKNSTTDILATPNLDIKSMISRDTNNDDNKMLVTNIRSDLGTLPKI